MRTYLLMQLEFILEMAVRLCRFIHCPILKIFADKDKEILTTLLPFSAVLLYFDNIPSVENLLSASTFQNDENYLIVVSNKDSTVFRI